MNNKIKANQIRRLVGAIRNGGAAGRMGILVRGVAPITSWLTFHMLAPVRYIEKVKGVFIVCPPRSGGTVIYQSIASALPGIPFTNAHVLFLRGGSGIVRKSRAKRKIADKRFKNYNGYTAALAGVNEGNEFLAWAYSQDSAEQKKKNFLKLLNVLSPMDMECVVMKNVRSFEVLDKIYAASTGSNFVFVRVKRDLQKVIESTVREYYDSGSFHPVPRQLENSNINDPIEFAVKQITQIESTLDEKFAKIPKASKYLINYEEFCQYPYRSLIDLATNYLGLAEGDINKTAAIDNIQRSNRSRVSEADSRKIIKVLGRK